MGYREKNFTVITLRAFRYFAACTATSRRGPSRRTIMVSVNSRRDYIVFPRTRVINFYPCSGRKIVFEHSSGRPFFIGLRHTGIYLYAYHRCSDPLRTNGDGTNIETADPSVGVVFFLFCPFAWRPFFLAISTSISCA